MRIYLVVIDETPEAEVALRFAARRVVHRRRTGRGAGPGGAADPVIEDGKIGHRSAFREAGGLGRAGGGQRAASNRASTSS